jgi:hypothetical protein
LKLFDASLTASKLTADVQNGLIIMAEYKSGKRPVQGLPKSNVSELPSHSGTRNLLKAVFDSSCDSELDTTPFKQSHGLAKRALGSPQNPARGTKRLKFPSEEAGSTGSSNSSSDSMKTADMELPLVDRLLAGTPSQPEPKAAAPSVKLKKTLFDFSRFDAEEPSNSERPSDSRIQEKFVTNIFSRSDSEKERRRRAAGGASKVKSSKLPKENLEPVPPPVNIQNLVGSRVFDYESDENVGDSKSTIKEKGKPSGSRAKQHHQEVKRRRSRTIAKMLACRQEVYTSEEEREESSNKVKERKAKNGAGRAKKQPALMVGKSQQRIDGFLARPVRKRGAVDVDELLKMPEEEELAMEQEEDIEEILQGERMRVLEANMARCAK